MKQKQSPMNTGKLDINILRQHLERNVILAPRVVIGPKIGEDAASLISGRGPARVLRIDLKGRKELKPLSQERF